MKFCNILKNLRVELGFSQKDVAEGSGLSPQCISQLEADTRNPTGITLVALANFFQCSTDYLLGREDDFGQITICQTDGINSLTAEEQKIIDALRRNTSTNAGDFLIMYTELPSYMQESIFAELKGMHLGYNSVKKNNYKGIK